MAPPVILCVCVNPAVDVTYEVDGLSIGVTHRVLAHHVRAGGKATNTATVLSQLGADVTLLAVLGADSIDRFAVHAESAQLRLRTVSIRGRTRTTVTVADSDDATVFVEPGPALSDGEWHRVLDEVAAAASHADAVVLSGSLPALPAGVGYRQLVGAAGRQRVVLDVGGPELRAALSAGPAVVCPNLAEARAAVGADIEPVTAARRLVALGAGAALVSCGDAGIVGATSTDAFRAVAGVRLAGNPTGAGDAVNAAVALGFAAGSDWRATARAAVALGGAAVPVRVAGAVDLDARDRLLAAATVEEVPGGAGAHG